MNKKASAEDDVEDDAMMWKRGQSSRFERPTINLHALYMSKTDKQTIIELGSTIDRSSFEIEVTKETRAPFNIARRPQASDLVDLPARIPVLLHTKRTIAASSARDDDTTRTVRARVFLGFCPGG
jgi:hypothetical protein